MNLLCDQSAVLRAHSPRAYQSGMWLRHNLKVSLRRNKLLCSVLSRGSLRGALQLDLLATVPDRIIIFLATVLFFAATTAHAGQLAPKLDIGKGGQCVEDPQLMRRKHMDFLKHQRDETMRFGIRGSKYSLVGCIDCHASSKNNSVLGSNENFCQGCHVFAGVRMDCFECHSSKRKAVAEAGK